MNDLRRSWLWLVLFGWVGLTSLLHGEEAAVSDSASIRYTVSLAGYAEHLLRVQVQIPPGAAQRQVQLPVWNALYQVRDFSQYINWLKARDGNGRSLPLRKLNKCTWEMDGAKDGATVEYQILADLPGPYGAQVNVNHAFFNLAEVLIYPVDGRAVEMQLKFTDVPSGWKFATALPVAGEGYKATNYDHLVDSPVEIGTFDEADFDEGGGHYRVVVDADRSDYDMQRIVADLHKIVGAATSWMNDRPFQTYLFLYHFPRGTGGGGMEHASSTAIDVSAEGLKDNPRSLEDVSAHEFFHLWNVKRIRPQSLEPIDYTKENYTRALWFSEGVTSTAEDIILLRAGLIDERTYLQRLGDRISEIEERPAHLAQSAEESSLDAWLEGNPYYRRPERSISYYTKGQLLGVILDLAVRDASHNRACLRDVLQGMNQSFAKQQKFFPDSAGVRQAAESVGHSDLSGFFQNYVSGVQEIPWDDFFKVVGLRVVRTTETVADFGFADVQNFDAPPSVIRVEPKSDAEKAGLAVGDVLLEINGKPATSHADEMMGDMRPGDTLHLRVRNRRGEGEVSWKLGSREEIDFQVRDQASVTPEQKAARAVWLKGEAQPAGDFRP